MLTIVVPIFNEEKSLVTILPVLQKISLENNWKVILVDDGSTDSTSTILSQYRDIINFTILEHTSNRGYGSALKTGFRSVTTPYVITYDGDGQHDVADISVLLHMALSQKADLVVGKRPSSNKPSYRDFGKFLIRLVASMLMKILIKDLNSGMKLYRTDLLLSFLPLCPDSMAFSDFITLCFLSQNYKVIENPIRIYPRNKGKSKVKLQTAFQTVNEILNIILLFNPVKIFLPVSLLFILVGFAWGIPFVLAGRGVSVGASLSIITGIIIFMIGLLAEQLSMLLKSGIK